MGSSRKPDEMDQLFRATARLNSKVLGLVLGILLAYTGNAGMKVAASWVSGRAPFALRVLPGQVLMVGLAWLGWALARWMMP